MQSYLEADATTPNLLASNVGSCCVCLQVAKRLPGFKLRATTPSKAQQHATGWVNGRNM